MKASTIFSLIIFLILLAFVILAFPFPAKARFAPLFVGIPAVVLMLREILTDISAGKKKQKKAEDFGGHIGGYIDAGGWTAGLLVGTYLFGIAAGFTAFTFLYLKSHKEGWRLSVISALTIFALIYVTMGVILRVDLYPGVLFD